MRNVVLSVKNSLRGTPFYTPVEAVYRGIYNTNRHLRRKLLQVDNTLVRDYLAGAQTKKLHLGCGNHILDDWLNCDYFPYSEKVMRLDVTERFPFADGTFDFVFSEHMIEHIPYVGGQNMLVESFRVLKPGGKVRITTPDLAFLFGLYQNDKTDQQKRYIQWTASDNPAVPFPLDTFVINNFVRAWGHQFIYDEKVLRGVFENAGFQDITRCNLNESAWEVYRNLENESKEPPGFLRLESITFEGTKRQK